MPLHIPRGTTISPEPLLLFHLAQDLHIEHCKLRIRHRSQHKTVRKPGFKPLLRRKRRFGEISQGFTHFMLDSYISRRVEVYALSALLCSPLEYPKWSGRYRLPGSSTGEVGMLLGIFSGWVAVTPLLGSPTYISTFLCWDGGPVPQHKNVLQVA